MKTKNVQFFVSSLIIFFVNSVFTHLHKQVPRVAKTAEKTDILLTENNIKNSKNSISSFRVIIETSGLDERSLRQSMTLQGSQVEDAKTHGFFSGRKFHQNNLTWKITKFSRNSDLTQDEQRDAIRRAFNIWSTVTPLEFREVPRGERANFKISFEVGDHGDGHPFDGQGVEGRNLLAHAFPPPSGEIHFDDDDDWINYPGKAGADLVRMAAHEIGHALGLRHVIEAGSIMSPLEHMFPKTLTLSELDIRAIQAKYGQHPSGQRLRPIVGRRPKPINGGFCDYDYKRIEATVRIQENTFLFLDDGEVVDGRTGRKTLIQHLFPMGPDYVDAAAYSERKEQVYLFYDHRIWVFNLNWNGHFILERNFPKIFTDSIFYRVEAAVCYVKFNKEILVVFKDNLYAEFPSNDWNIEYLASYSVNYYLDLPKNIDAAFSKGNQVFFIVKDKAYPMNISSTYFEQVSQRPTTTNKIFDECNPQ